MHLFKTFIPTFRFYIYDTGDNGMYYHNGMKFTTHDQDNDLSTTGNCANARRGGWWYNHCFFACLTCYTEKFEWDTLPENMMLLTSRMMIKPQ